MDDLDCTSEQKLKGAMSLLRDEAYQWWLTGKYVGASYVDARRKDFLNLVQVDRSVAEYEVEFLRLSQYARGIVATEYEHHVQFEDCLRDSLRVLIASERERDFVTLVKKAKITEEVKRVKRQNQEKERSRNKRVLETSTSDRRPKRNARIEGPIRVRAPVAVIGSQPCAGYGSYHRGDCWKRTGTCFRCGSTEHFARDCLQRSG
ncbi:uncharacterized protein LOC108473557 [Gossypium arboreum]|uniref:uncharacterized protein LOC108473557 n=1 Tax=Gossypium arboreum TaxID=29729 RepID=UPI00081961E7|nr:uncharacterized protein LOC108473557 [Gossypium arboreum]